MDNNKPTIIYNPNAKKTSTKVLNKKIVNKNNVNTKKINEDDELPKTDKVGRDTGLKIQKARLAKGFNQKMISNKMNMDTTTYQKYENGTAVRNGSILNKLGKLLGVKLTGKDV